MSIKALQCIGSSTQFLTVGVSKLLTYHLMKQHLRYYSVPHRYDVLEINYQINIPPKDEHDAISTQKSSIQHHKLVQSFPEIEQDSKKIKNPLLEEEKSTSSFLGIFQMTKGTH